jgi:hypothetical protein
MSEIKPAFEPDGVVVRLDRLIETRGYRPEVKASAKYQQIVNSIAAIGLVEPPAVRAEPRDTGRFYLLDGHLRIMALRDQGVAEVLCLVSTDDEAFTFNKRISRLTAAQEHRMIARALERGVPEHQLAEALGFGPKEFRSRSQLLRGIAPEVARLLSQEPCAFGVYAALRRMRPSRQLEAVELMRAQANFSHAFAHALLAATAPEELVTRRRARAPTVVTREQVNRLQDELTALQLQVRSLDDHFGLDALHFTLARGYLGRLLQCGSIAAWIARERPEYVEEFRGIAEASPLEAALPVEQTG